MNLVRQALCFQLITELRSTAILPYNGVIDRFFGVNIPHNRSFALVGNTNTCDVKAVNIYGRDSLSDDRSLRRPYFVGVMLYPSRLWKVLCKLFLCYRLYVSVVVKDDGS